MNKRPILIFSAVLAIALGWYQLFAFSTKPGAQFTAPAHLPQDIPNILSSSFSPATPAPPLLLVFVHPRCSCTSATLAELDQLLSSAPNPVRIALVTYSSPAVNRPIDPAAALHHPAKVVLDPGGALARRFGAATSGELILYSPSGQLLFQGGITPMRSETGDNAGADALRLALATGRSQTKAVSVFGCSIYLARHDG